MELLDEVLSVSGGLTQWRQLRRFTIHLSIGGVICTRLPGPASLKDMVVEGSVHEQSLEMTGFAAPDRRALYRPDRVALERSDGNLIEERVATASEFRSSLSSRIWDQLMLAFFCGSLIRRYLDIPFVLADADVLSRGLESPAGRDPQLRAVKVDFPERLSALTAQSTLYFDDQAMLRRQEYPALHEDRATIAQTYSGHQRYSGFLVPTLSRLTLREGHCAPRPGSALVDIEIFDAAFE